MTTPFATCELFAGLSAAEIAQIEALSERVIFPAGAEIFGLGDEATGVFVVLSGTVELTLPIVVLGKREQICFQTLGAGAALAWSALVAPHVLTMAARSPSTADLLRLPAARLHALFDAQPNVGRVVMTNLAQLIAARLHVAHALWIREMQRSLAQTYK